MITIHCRNGSFLLGRKEKPPRESNPQAVYTDTIFLSRERRYLYVSYFTSKGLFLVVPLNGDDEEIRKIDLFLRILEKSGVAEVIRSSYSKLNKNGRKSYNPYNLFAMVLYSFALKRGSLRDMEEFCRYDLRARYLMEQETPSYKTICEFINEVIVDDAYKLFSLITKAIIEEFDIDISDQYLDGTKIEANANKYKFVWKPRKIRKALEEKISRLSEKIGLPYKKKETVSSISFYERLSAYGEKEGIDPEEIPKGKGHRLSSSQRLLKEGMNCLSKLLDYEEREKICGPDRNSYYKTDHDATAMALKTDYYSGHGSNMHAAYNVQFLVSAGLVTLYGVYQYRTDYHTLIPMLDKYHELYDSYPKNLCADSGYGIEENYIFLSDNKIGNYVKYLSWNGERNAKNPQMFSLNDQKDGFLCLNGAEGRKIVSLSRHPHNKSASFYSFEGCRECGYAYLCKKKIKNKEENFRTAELSIDYEKHKEEARKNLLSVKGIEIRINRSVQAEGSFGQLKQNLSYVRTRRRGLSRVSAEIMMMALSVNIRKLFTFSSKDSIHSHYWEADENTEPETIKKPKKKAVTD